MGELVFTTGPDLMSGDSNNFIADFYGTGRLSSVNLVPDAALREWNPDTGKHKYFHLGEPPRPTHWLAFMRDNDRVRNFAAQTTHPIPLSRDVYDHDTQLVRGRMPEDDSRTLDIARPAKPKASAINVGNHIGLPEGYYCIAFGWITGENWESTTLITNPGPRIPGPGDTGLFVPQGDGLLLTMPTEKPAKATGIAVFLTEPKNSPTAALVADMFLAARYNIRGLDQYVRLMQPFSYKEKVSDILNHTYIGKRSDLPGIETRRGRNKFGRRSRPLEVRLGYSFYTEQGISMSSEFTDWVKMQAGKTSLHFRPKDFPAGVIGWRPEVQFNVEKDKELSEAQEGMSEWYGIAPEKGNHPYMQRREWAGIYVSVPDFWEDNSPNTRLVMIQRGDNDNTGIPEPTEGLEMPTVLDMNSSSMSPGSYMVKTALCVGDEEGPTSLKATKVKVTGGEGIRVKRPKIHNLLDNSDAGERHLTDFEVPRGWIMQPKPWPEGFFVRPVGEGLMRITDTPTSSVIANSDMVAFRTPYAFLDSDMDKFIIKFAARCTHYGGGRVRIYVEEYFDEPYDPANPGKDLSPAEASVVTGVPPSRIENFSGISEWVTHYVRLKREGNVSVGVHLLDSRTVAVRLRVDVIGTQRGAARNQIVDFKNMGVFEGWAPPKKVNELDAQWGDDDEPPELIFPQGGYCIVRRNPNDEPKFADYTLLDKNGFENSIGNWEPTTTGSNLAARGFNAAMHGEYGLVIRKNETIGTNNTSMAYVWQAFAAGAGLAVAADVYINAHSNHTVEFMDIRTAGGGSVLAFLSLTGAGSLTLNPVTSAGVGEPVVLATGIDIHERFSVELEVIGAGTNDGKIKVFLGKYSDTRTHVATIGEGLGNGIAWSDRLAGSVTIGHRRANLNGLALFTLYFDSVVVTRDGTSKTRPQGGNYFEYYGPPRTPFNERYGPTGLKIPVRPNEQLSFGVNVKYEDLKEGSSVYRFRAMDQDGKVTNVYPALVKDIGGTVEEWERHTVTYTMPDDAAYIEFFANNLGAGTIKIHGLQVERGPNSTDFTYQHERSGWVKLYARTRPEGMAARDPMGALGVVEDLRRVVEFIDDDAPGTSYLIRYRSANTKDALASQPYTTNYNLLNTDHAFIEIRVDLSTDNDNFSPEFRGLEIELVRKYSILCREDGTEFDGGVLVNNISGVSAPKPNSNIQMADGSISDNPWGTRAIKRMTFDIHAFRRNTKEAITEDKYAIVETPDRRYHIRFEEVPSFEPLPHTRLLLDNNEVFQQYVATGVSAIVDIVEKLD